MKKLIKKTIALVIALGLMTSLPAYAFDWNMKDMSVEVTNALGKPGDKVKIKINLENNPGIASLMFNVVYDDVLTLEAVKLSDAFGSYITTSPEYTNPQLISMISPFEEIDLDGTIAELTFMISPKANASSIAKIQIQCDEDNIFNGDYENVPVSVVNGKVTIKDIEKEEGKNDIEEEQGGVKERETEAHQTAGGDKKVTNQFSRFIAVMRNTIQRAKKLFRRRK